MVEHKYGGRQTDVKLDVLRRYLAFFTTALKQQHFALWYIDGFAGTGERLVERIIARGAPLWGEEQVVERMQVPGSAQLALSTEPPFDRLIFIEKHGPRYRALVDLCRKHPERRIDPLQGDANDLITRFCRSTHWRGPRAPGRGIRAVLFLDPYGMKVDFSTLQAIADTQAIDLWYLFSLSGVYRQASLSKPKVMGDRRKRAALTRILGSDEWERRFYAPSSHEMFPEFDSGRTADVDEIEAYVKERLEVVFPKVLAPLRLHNERNAPIFSLFFAMSSRSPKAWGLATRAANQILTGSSSHVLPRK